MPLRARTPDGIEQEIYALLVAYQVLRTAIADATATVPGTDPDRASFTVALNAARDQVILAAGVTAGTITDLAGTIGRLVLASLMPSRRLRVSPRAVERAMSKYNAKGKVDRTTRKATIAITIARETSSERVISLARFHNLSSQAALSLPEVFPQVCKGVT
jgi:hypothetical protein